MTETSKAVILSYARVATDSARRLAAALRSHAVETWFDQSHLRGSEEWDGKLKTPFRDVALYT